VAGAAGRGDRIGQDFPALHFVVSVPDALVAVAVGAAHRVIDIQPGHRIPITGCRSRQQDRQRGQFHQ